MTSLVDLAERIQKAIVRGRGIRLEAAELDLLVSIGFNDLVQLEAAKLVKKQAQERMAAANEARADTINRRRLPPTAADVDDALRRARRIAGLD